MVDAVTAATAAAVTTPTKADNAMSDFSADFENFLKIFITQLENQDPLEPQDSSEFTSQIAQFSAVEQSVQSNKNLETIIEIFQNDNNANLVSYSGKYVEVAGDTISLEADGDENTFNYTLDEPARQAYVTIFDSSNNIVYNGEAIAAAGKNYITWEGNDNDGNPAQAGKYRVQISISDQEQNILTVDTVVKGRVDGVNLEGEPVLIVNGKTIPISDVKFIGEA